MNSSLKNTQRRTRLSAAPAQPSELKDLPAQQNWPAQKNWLVALGSKRIRTLFEASATPATFGRI